jgi:transposase
LETCAEAFAIADKLEARGLEVAVVPAVLAPQLGVGHRGVKTDVRDAQVLSEMSCRMSKVPSVHVPRTESRERKSLLAAKDSLVRARTLLINSVRGYLRTKLVKPCKKSPRFTQHVRDAYARTGHGVPAFIEAELAVIDSINEQIAELTKTIGALAKKDPVVSKLMTVPGVGPMTALAFASTIDKVERFDNASQIVSYLGLHPGERSSGARIRRLGISKAGAARVRTYLVQAAWSMWRCRPRDPNVEWARAIAERRGAFKAIVALARKLARILYAIWRDEKAYRPPSRRVAV